MFALVKEKVEAFGTCVVTTETEDGLSLSYTVGLEKTWQHPELIIVGTGSIGEKVLNAITKRMISSGSHLQPDQVVTKAQLDYSVDFRVRAPLADLVDENLHPDVPIPIRLNVVRAFYKHEPLPDGRKPRALQILWPTKHGAWPDHEPSLDQPCL